jgi:hypothetical protein
MRRPWEKMLALLVLPILLASAPAEAVSDIEEFSYPDGTFPPGWVWTGYSEDGGEFTVQDSAFTHVSGGAVYYLWRGPRHLGALHYFIVRGGNWVYGFRITQDDPSEGRCLLLSHDDSSGSWGINFMEFEWHTLDPGQYPEGQYMWHNGVALRSVHSPTSGPLEEWHHISIDCEAPLRAIIKLDNVVIFDEAYEYIPMGDVGLGSNGSTPMVPAFDYFEVAWPCPAEVSSWTRVKSLYR